MQVIKIWCEYDINGEFGGNNDEDCLLLDENLTSQEDIEAAVLSYISRQTGEPTEELEGLCGWELINLLTLEKGE